MYLLKKESVHFYYKNQISSTDGFFCILRRKKKKNVPIDLRNSTFKNPKSKLYFFFFLAIMIS